MINKQQDQDVPYDFGLFSYLTAMRNVDCEVFDRVQININFSAKSDEM